MPAFARSHPVDKCYIQSTAILKNIQRFASANEASANEASESILYSLVLTVVKTDRSRLRVEAEQVQVEFSSYLTQVIEWPRK